MAVIVAVDDNVILRKLLTLTLSMLSSVDSSITFHIFSSGEEVIEFAEKNEVNFFIIDWFMPTCSGDLLLKRIRAYPKYKETPIVVLSGEDSRTIKESARNLGATGWLTKPFNPDTLKVLIYKLLGRYCCLQVSLPNNYYGYNKI